MLCVLKILSVIGISLGAVVGWQFLSSTPAAAQLDEYLDRFERTETARQSAASGEAVLITVTLDSIDSRRGDREHPLSAVVHLKLNGREYARRNLLYSTFAELWAWEERPGEEWQATAAAEIYTVIPVLHAPAEAPVLRFALGGCPVSPRPPRALFTSWGLA